jgi:hypothetical protein
MEAGMAIVECGCGKKFEVGKDGTGYERLRAHWREEQALLSPVDWYEVQKKIEAGTERQKKRERADGVGRI